MHRNAALSSGCESREIAPDGVELRARSFNEPGDIDRLTGGQAWDQFSMPYDRETDLPAGEAFPGSLGRRLLLLRHGQTNFNVDGRVQGSSDTSRLSDEGKKQAQAVGEFLVQLPIESVFVSPLTRAQETLDEAAQIVRKYDKSESRGSLGLENNTHILKDLREVDLHEWEGLYKKQIKEQWPEIYEQWRGSRPADFCLLGRYPIRDLWSRARSVWARVFSHDTAGDGTRGLGRLPSRITGHHAHTHAGTGKGCTLLIAHNGINQALLATAFGLTEDAFRSFEFPNCGVVELIWKPGEKTAAMWRWIYPTPSTWKTEEQTRIEWQKSTAPISEPEAPDPREQIRDGTASPKADGRDWKQMPRRPHIARVDSTPCVD